MSESPGAYLEGLGAPTFAVQELVDASRELQSRLARRMGMNPTDMVALRMLDVHGPLGMTELARHLDLRPASATTVVDRLEAAGHIERVREHGDRRRVTIRVRDEAVRFSLETWEPVIRALDEVGRGLGPDEQRTVCAFLDGVAAVMRGERR